jgi:hypothetical protein
MVGRLTLNQLSLGSNPGGATNLESRPDKRAGIAWKAIGAG